MFILLTRADPPLHLPRRRARGEMVEIRAADLRFPRREAKEFLRNCMQLDLSEEDMTSLETRTEGWITGLQLAAITLRTIEDRHSFIQAFHGDDRLVADYLVEEVLLQQPEENQSFLLRTSVLGRFNATLCNALTGRTGSARLLAQMENENLFLIPLDNQREWFRYHSLFARLLQKKLEQSIGLQAVHEMLHRASEECIRQGLLVEGVQYLFSAGDESGAAELIYSTPMRYSPSMNCRPYCSGPCVCQTKSFATCLGCALPLAGQPTPPGTRISPSILLIWSRQTAASPSRRSFRYRRKNSRPCQSESLARIIETVVLKLAWRSTGASRLKPWTGTAVFCPGWLYRT